MSFENLQKLKSEHDKLQTAIEKALDQNPVNDTKLSVMKKQKLWLKDKITNIEKEQEITNTV
jgi:hypothetical protein